MFRLLKNNRGTWGAVAAATISAGAGIYSANKAKGARSNLEGFQLPVYEEDKDYNDAQAILKALGSNILEGDIPDFYSDIGKQGSDSFMDFLNMSNAKISDSILESAAVTGRRGGAVQSMIAESVGENTTKLGYQDYLTALQGKEYLFNTGTNLLTDVRSAGQKREAMKNQFTQNNSEMDFNYRQAKDESDAALGAAEGDAMANLIDMGIGAVTGAAGGGGVKGAANGILGAAGYADILNNTKTSLPNVVGGSGNTKIKKGMISGSSSGAYDALLQILSNNN